MRSVAVLATCLAATASTSACTFEPSKAALDFYESHKSFIHAGAESPPLTEELARAVKANIEGALDKGEVGAINWNFWTGAQDGEQSRTAKVVHVALKGARAEVVLAYRFDLGGTWRQTELRATVHLIKAQDKCWLIADLKRGRQSVAKLLRATAARQVTR